MPITYSIALDNNHDGDFNEDISAQVLDLRWQLGLAQAYDSCAPTARAQITVRNPDGRFSPEITSLEPGTRMHIQSNDGSTIRTHFTGAIGSIQTQAGNQGRKTAIIHLHDIMDWLQASPISIQPQVAVTADGVIDELLNRALLRRDILEGYCIIDVDGYNLIDSVMIYASETVSRNLQSGKSTFAYVGDTWQAGISTYDAILELAESERGRFYMDREGQAVFLNRHYTLITDSLSASFSDDMEDLRYRYGEHRVNRIELTITPRYIGADNTTLWMLVTPQGIPQATGRNLTIRFVDEENQPVGALSIDSIDFEFHAANGTSLSTGFTVHVIETSFNSLSLRIDNTSAQTIYLTSLNIKGTPLYTDNPLHIIVQDGERVYLDGVSTLRRNLPALSNIEVATAFAEYELQRRKHPSGVVETLSTSTQTHPTETLDLSLFDRIRITESQTGHIVQDYFIIAEAHHVEKAGKVHQVTWTLEPADSSHFIIVNSSDIDSTSRLIAPY